MTFEGSCGFETRSWYDDAKSLHMRGLYICIACYFVALCSLDAQNVHKKASISIHPLKLNTQQSLNITIQHKGGKIKVHSAFPNLKGFVKQGTSQSMQMNSGAGGSISIQHSLTQHYRPKAAGRYRLSQLQMQVNSQLTTHPSVEISVTEHQSVPHKPAFSQGNSPFDLFLDMFRDPSKKEAFTDIKDNAFLSLRANKKEIFLGEGVTVTLAFYVSAENPSLDFHKLDAQLGPIINKIKPEGCWEENFRIQNIERERVEIKDKPYLRFVLYKAVLYPLRIDPMVFPSVGLKMVKYKIANSFSTWGRRGKPSYKSFYTKKQTVRIRPLPPHPLQSQVAVGRYRILREEKARKTNTGEGFDHTFVIGGEGNISTLPPPNAHSPTKKLVIYPPKIQQKIHHTQGRVFGEKSFTYHILPQEAGTYLLKNYLDWVYFDPSRARYDTLRPQLTFHVEGKSVRNLQVTGNESDSFYRTLLRKNPQATNALNALAWKHWTAVFVLSLTLILAFSLKLRHRRRGKGRAN